MATIKLPVSQGKYLNFRWIFDAEDNAIARCEDQRYVDQIIHALNSAPETETSKEQRRLQNLKDGL